MEITKTSFQPRLLDVLEAISESHFVAFDTELSGVPVRPSGPGSSGKASLQERYLEIKKAAETYQILQIGLTFVTQDLATGTYELKPYNFYLNPIIEEKLDLDRTFSFHSGAVEFLLGVNFDFHAPYRLGVPYLSRDEAKEAREKAYARHDRGSNAISDMTIDAGDTEALRLMQRVRAEIDKWQKSDKDVLLIGPAETTSEHKGPSAYELSRFERRLIHQLVRAEYPGLVSIPKRGNIQIIPFDEERENAIKEQRKREARERISRQSGFRWIVEALCGNDFRQIDIKSFAFHPDTGIPAFVNLDDIRARFQRAQLLLRNKPRVLVGHNLFLDLIYLYRTFMGPLPESVEEFQNIIHELFPTIIDTKYLATHNCGDINPTSSLQQIAEHLQDQQRPRIKTAKGYSKYDRETAFHEAGYDSMLTATIAIQLSAKLEANGHYVESRDSAPGDHDTATSGGVSLDGVPDVPSTEMSSSAEANEFTTTRAVTGIKNLLLAPVKVLSGNSNDLRKKPESQSSARNGAVSSSRFGHATRFDMLSNDHVEDEDDQEVLQFDDLPSSSVVPDTNGEIPAADALDSWPIDVHPAKWEPMRLMPPFSSDFWTTYGNKLRVFGTKESMSVLNADDGASGTA